jgi:hypothetical protein
MKTVRTDADVNTFIAALPDGVGDDCQQLVELMSRVTGDEPALYGPSIVGFGSRDVTYANGKTIKWMTTGFSPRKANLVIYLRSGFEQSPHFARLGKAKASGKGCLAIKRLSDVDMEALQALVQESVDHFEG